MGFARLCGLLFLLFPVVCTLAAISLSPGFSLKENWLSDLAGLPGERPIWSARGFPSVLFNLGLVAGGAAGAVFAAGVRKEGRKIGGTLLFLCSLSQGFVGMFPETVYHPHMAASVSLFFLIPLSLLFLAVGEKSRLRWAFTFFFCLSLVASLLLLAVPRPWGKNAIAESLSWMSLGASVLLASFTRAPTSQINPGVS
jgi:hypothetical membrane protein